MAISPFSNDSADPIPSFAGIAALWFAVLCGLGALMLPEQFVPALGAPLGLSARELAVLVAAGVGALGGFSLARLVEPDGGEGTGLDQPAIRPFNVRDELDWSDPELPEAASAEPLAEDADAALRASLARLRELRGAA